jgi:hypothetical protein
MGEAYLNAEADQAFSIGRDRGDRHGASSLVDRGPIIRRLLARHRLADGGGGGGCMAVAA